MGDTITKHTRAFHENRVPSLLHIIGLINITTQIFGRYPLPLSTSNELQPPPYGQIYQKPTTATTTTATTMPVNHIVLFQFKADASPEAVQKVRLPSYKA